MKKFPYLVTMGYCHAQYQAQVMTWCRENFGVEWQITGNRSGTWCCFWSGFRKNGESGYEYHFANESDAVLFSLRWT